MARELPVLVVAFWALFLWLAGVFEVHLCHLLGWPCNGSLDELLAFSRYLRLSSVLWVNRDQTVSSFLGKKELLYCVSFEVCFGCSLGYIRYIPRF